MSDDPYSTFQPPSIKKRGTFFSQADFSTENDQDSIAQQDNDFCDALQPIDEEFKVVKK